MRYLLDTNICIYIMKRKPQGVRERFAQFRSGEVVMSVVTYLELVYGAHKSNRLAESHATLERLVTVIPVQALDAGAARHYARLRVELQGRGQPIGAFDMLIAAHALALNLTLVSNNTREFSRVPGLKIENWVD